MKKRSVLLGVVAVCATVLSLLPAGADPLSQRDMTSVLQQAPKRYLASEPGKREQLSLVFGPYEIPPGQDSNRISVDFQLPAGFVQAVSPDLVDATSGRVPTQQEAHIHHAHWFRVTDDQSELYYTDAGDIASGNLPDFVPPEVAKTIPAHFGLSWVFGTGEEKTQGGFEPREALDDFTHREYNNETSSFDIKPGADGVPDQRYGMQIDEGERQVLIYMIHNKTSSPLQVFVVLDVDYVFGTSQSIEAATGIPMHPLKGQLFGQTADATPSYPTLIGARSATSGRYGWNVELDGTAIVAGGHAHPGVYGVFLTNEGPGAKCKADIDHDGFPGVTLLDSRHIDHVAATWPYSEDFQMGVAKYGWRASVHKGDYLTQYGVYDINNETTAASGRLNGNNAAAYALPANSNAEALGFPTAADLGTRDTVDGLSHKNYAAMNHVGVYVDPLQAPTAYDATVDAAGCPTNFEAAVTPHLLGADTPQVQQRLRPDQWGIAPYYANGVTEGMGNHVWAVKDNTCGPSIYSQRAVCNNGAKYPNDHSGIATDTIHISGFLFMPGQAGAPGALGAPAIISASKPLRIVNEDAGANIRHSLTTCPAPCTGLYVANYPFPDGVLDTGKLGNIDPIDGGLTGSDTVPVYTLAANKLTAGKLYTYFCRIHPFMRGAFETTV